MHLFSKNDYSPPLKDSQNESNSDKNKRQSWLKYIIAIQLIVIVTIIIAYSKSNPDASSLSIPDNIYDINNNNDNRIEIPYRTSYCSDPLGLISELIGRWYSDNGYDIIYGIKTYYTEFLTFEPLTYGILNPSKPDPSYINNEEEIFGVRYFRQIISNSNNNKNHIFPPSTPIHEETGYLLFMFIFDQNGQNPKFNRIIKSIAIPRGQNVLAHAEYNDKDVYFDIDKNIITYNLTTDGKDYGIGNAKFTSTYSYVPSFTQNVSIDLNNHIFKYFQSTPVIMNGKIIDHDNTATLTKLNI